MPFRSSRILPAIARVLATVACIALLPLAAVEEKDRLPPGAEYLRSFTTSSAVLSPDSGAVLTCENINVGSVPIFFNNFLGEHPLDNVHARLQLDPRADAPESTWGPDTMDQEVALNRINMRLSGGLPNEQEADPPYRKGLILLPDEGYANRLVLLPGWIASGAVPQSHRYMTLSFANFSVFSLPLQGTKIVQGKPIHFSDEVILGFNPLLLLPFSHTTPAPARMSDWSSATTPLYLECALPAHPAAGKDLIITYLIGNSGDKPVWVAQNHLVAALTAWEVRSDGKLVAMIPASDLAAKSKDRHVVSSR